MNSTYEVDFYKQFKLVPPVCGLVNKVTSPKGIKSEETDTYTSYRLHSELCDIYKGEAVALEPGIYWVLDVCKVKGNMTWNQYLFVIDKDGEIYPVAEYLYQPDSSWVKQAVKILKAYYNEVTLTPIKLTCIDHRLVDKDTHWCTKKSS